MPTTSWKKIFQRLRSLRPSWTQQPRLAKTSATKSPKPPPNMPTALRYKPRGSSTLRKPGWLLETFHSTRVHNATLQSKASTSNDSTQEPRQFGLFGCCHSPGGDGFRGAEFV